MEQAAQPRLTFSDDFGGAWQHSNSASWPVFWEFICKVRHEIHKTRVRPCIGNEINIVCVRRDQSCAYRFALLVLTQMKPHNETSVSVNGAQFHPQI